LLVGQHIILANKNLDVLSHLYALGPWNFSRYHLKGARNNTNKFEALPKNLNIKQVYTDENLVEHRLGLKKQSEMFTLKKCEDFIPTIVFQPSWLLGIKFSQKPNIFFSRHFAHFRLKHVVLKAKITIANISNSFWYFLSGSSEGKKIFLFFYEKILQVVQSEWLNNQVDDMVYRPFHSFSFFFSPFSAKCCLLTSTCFINGQIVLVFVIPNCWLHSILIKTSKWMKCILGESGQAISFVINFQVERQDSFLEKEGCNSLEFELEMCCQVESSQTRERRLGKHFNTLSVRPFLCI